MARRGRNAAAFEHSLTALRVGGRIEAVDAALIAVGRTLAGDLDDPDLTTSQTAWAYLAVLKTLRGAAVNADDGLAELVAAMQGSMGDAPES
ncbi:MAG TPA: hypothetical protein VGH66_00270 [Acidimicrobiales bacterium]